MAAARQNEMKESATVVATTTFAVEFGLASEDMNSRMRFAETDCILPQAREFQAVGRLISADLRERQRADQVVRDVGDDLGIRQARRGPQLLPSGIGAKGLPDLIAAGEILVGEHVGQVGLARADKVSPKNTGWPPARWKAPISPSLNILILRFSVPVLLDSYWRNSNRRAGRLPSLGGGTTFG